MNTQQMLLALLIARCQVLEHQAQHDALTGAYNRHALKSIVFKPQLLVIAIDIIGLGETNNKLGHHEGDKLIKNVATEIKSSIRQSDYLIRFGGDEFLVIAPDCGEHGASAILNRINQIRAIYHEYAIGFDNVDTLVRAAFAKVEMQKNIIKNSTLNS